MAAPFKVHELLKDHGEELAELEAFARDPGRTIDECHEWLLAKGYVLSRSAVGAWKQSFDGQVMAERFSRAADLAGALRETVEKHGMVGITQGTISNMSQVLFEQVALMQTRGEASAEDIFMITGAIKKLLDAEKLITELREEFEKKEKTALAAAEKVAKDGGSTTDVVSKVREILGIK